MRNDKNDLIIKIIKHSEYTKYYYHPHCYIQTINFIKYHIPTCTEDINGFNNLSLHKQSQLTDILLPNYICKSFRYQLKIDEININTLTDKQLELYLQQRDIKYYNLKNKFQAPQWKRETALNKLMLFLESNECKLKNKALVNGFCANAQKQLKLNIIPLSIYNLILKHCSVYIYFIDISNL